MIIGKLLIQLFSIFMTVTPQANAAIFGADDREAITPSSRSYPLARSTAVAVLNSLIEPAKTGDGFDIFADSLNEFMCRQEKFSNTPSIAYACTGFLVAPDLLITAGHCMVNVGESRNETEQYCKVYSWMFDYNESTDGKTQTQNISSENIYNCKQIIFAVSDDDKKPNRDFALIQLDRPVTGRTPLKLAHRPVTPRDRVTMIGYPLGGPAKFSRESRITKNDLNESTFVTNLDALQGNSGSPVFNQQKEVVGILVSGTPEANLIDRKHDPKHKNSRGYNNSLKCEVYNRCDNFGKNCTVPGSLDEAAGSDVQRIEPLIDLIEQFERTR